MSERTMTLTRRELLESSIAALVASVIATMPLAPLGAQPRRVAPKFLTPAEYAMLDELTEIIIPTDAHSPGAKAAGVAAFIDFRLSDSLEPAFRASWREGLAGVDQLSTEMHGKKFMASTAAERVAVVTKMAANEESPKAPHERFFGRLKRQTARGYYSSKVGIHQDQRYKGNVFQRGKFAGYLPD